MEGERTCRSPRLLEDAGLERALLLERLERVLELGCELGVLVCGLKVLGEQPVRVAVDEDDGRHRLKGEVLWRGEVSCSAWKRQGERTMGEGGVSGGGRRTRCVRRRGTPLPLRPRPHCSWCLFVLVVGLLESGTEPGSEHRRHPVPYRLRRLSSSSRLWQAVLASGTAPAPVSLTLLLRSREQKRCSAELDWTARKCTACRETVLFSQRRRLSTCSLPRPTVADLL